MSTSDATAHLPPAGLTLRVATLGDWDLLAGMLNRCRAADGLNELRSGASLADEFPDSDFFTLARDGLVAEIDGLPVGWGMAFRVEREGILVAEMLGAVEPAYRGRGVGTAIWRANHARVARELASDIRPGPRELRSYAMESEVLDIALLHGQGYVPIRYGFEMRRSLGGPLTSHPLPPGLEIRPAVEADYRAIFDADAEAFEDHWGHRPKTEADFRARFYGSEMDPSLYVVAWDGDQVAGSVLNAIYTEENEALGIHRAWLEHVSVRRPWRGLGLAKALCTASFQLLRDAGMDEAWLGVDGTNPTGALQLYEGLGFAVTRRWAAYGRPVDRPAPDGWRSGDG